MHLIALHEDGSNNPIGVRSDIDKIPFHYYYAVKDLYGLVILAIVSFYFCVFISICIGGSGKF